MITESLVKRAAGEYDCEVVQRLNLDALGIHKISSLGNCIILKELYLGKNEITEISGLDCVSGTLEKLDLSFNRINSLLNLETMTRLKWLDLRENQISKFSDVGELAMLPNLRTIYFQGLDDNHSNPICKLILYAPQILAINPEITILDGHHCGLIQVVASVEEAMKNVKPDLVAFSEVPPCPWFQQEELLVPEDVLANQNSATGGADAAIKRLEAMLSTDSNHLLRKAQSTLQKVLEGSK